MTSQTKLIFAHVLSGRAITQLQALELYQCMRLAEIVRRLRLKYEPLGYTFKTELIGKKRYGRYSMIKPMKDGN